MPRNTTTAFNTAIQEQELRLALFVEMHFAGSIVYVWSGSGSYTFNGQTWLGVGTFGSVSTIEEVGTVEAKGITLTLSGIDTTLLPDALSNVRQGLPVLVYLALFDASNALISSPALSFSGRMDQPTVNVGGETASISINCESRLMDMNTAVDRRYTNEDQRIDHPTDRGFEFVASIQEVTIYWGRTPNGHNL